MANLDSREIFMNGLSLLGIQNLTLVYYLLTVTFLLNFRKTTVIKNFKDKTMFFYDD